MKTSFSNLFKGSTLPLLLISFLLTHCGGSGGGNNGGNGDFQQTEVPDIRAFCQGIDAVDMTTPDVVTVEGANCSEAGLRNAMTAGGKVLLNCPGTIVLSQEIVVENTNLVLDFGGGTVSGGNSTRLFKFRQSVVTLQNGTLEDGQAPDAPAMGATQANWYDLGPGGHINAQGPGDLTAKNMLFQRGRTGPAGVDAAAETIIGTGNGGSIYLFAINNFTCDECIFDDNRAVNGAGVAGLGSSMRFINSVGSNNRALINGHPANNNQGKGGFTFADDFGHSAKDGDNYYSFCSTQIINNYAEVEGGGIYTFNRGGTDLDFLITQSTIQDNRAGRQGGGVYWYRVPFEPIDHYNDRGDDSFLVIGNLFSNNEALDNGGAISLQNIHSTAEYPLLGVMANNTFDNNRVTYDPPGVENENGYGGAAYCLGCYMTWIHNTFVENSSANLHGGMIVTGEYRFINNLMVNNYASEVPGGPAVASEHVAGFPEDPTRHYNNVYFPAGSFTPGGLGLGDPLLGSLEDNGGATSTFALGAGSPAIDAGVVPDDLPFSYEDFLANDQRNVGFPRIMGGLPDIGAFEVQ